MGIGARHWGLPAAQAIGIVVALPLLALAPPANGHMLLVPTSRDAAAHLTAIAVAGGARLVSRGPLPASLIIDGTRADFDTKLRAAGVLILAAPGMACGTSVPEPAA